MKGKYRLQASMKGVYWDIMVTRKITVISGYSATGKSTFCTAFNQSKHHSDVPCIVVPNGSGQEQILRGLLLATTNSVLILDEPGPYINTPEFLKLIRDCNCYFIIISHNSLKGLTFSVKDIYKMYFDGTTNKILPIYSDRIKYRDNTTVQRIITEDSGSGNILLNKFTKAESSNGKDNIQDSVSATPTLYCVDGAAFGSNVEYFDAKILSVCPESVVCMTESFEYNVLTWTSIRYKVDPNVMDALLNCEYPKYLTWEQYYTDVLKRVIPEYTKSRLCGYLNNSTIIGQYKSAIEKFTGLHLSQATELSDIQLNKLKELYPVAYDVYTSGGDLFDVQPMLDDICSRY